MRLEGKRGVRQFVSYSKVYLGLFLLVAGLQALGHDTLSSLENDSTFRRLLTYPPELGRQFGFTYTTLIERNCPPCSDHMDIVDGVALLLPYDKIELNREITLSLPYRSRVRFKMR